MTPLLNREEGDPNRQWQWRVTTSIEISQVLEVLRSKAIALHLQNKRWRREKHTGDIPEEGCEVRRVLLWRLRLRNPQARASRDGRLQDVRVIEETFESGKVMWIKASRTSAQILCFTCSILIWFVFGGGQDCALPEVHVDVRQAVPFKQSGEAAVWVRAGGQSF